MVIDAKKEHLDMFKKANENCAKKAAEAKAAATG